MRLEMVEESLVEKLKVVSEEQRRRAVKVACELALQACPVEVSIVAESLRCLQSGNKLTTDLLSGLDALAAQLDEKYFDLQDSLDEGQSLNVEGLQLFSQARAVSALSLAGREDSLMAATEAIYEASSAVDDGANIFKAVLSVLPKS
ncbi:hypothetical protein ALO52_200192 [Pseudomonas syringae pv. primulae]|uniref:Uncharacterized protein n=1 Tax=Pseudomonas syringae pv. primulae TaxID=251707 RepID=A0A0P9YJT8_9PSED|nr:MULTISPECIES: hypothetical protein [Pseudomonas syringae group]KPY38163.1 hypothetical protein ALO52_200192 [Pseudomonas syringae pv. primulae]